MHICSLFYSENRSLTSASTALKCSCCSFRPRTFFKWLTSSYSSASRLFFFLLLPIWQFLKFAGQLSALLLSCAGRSQVWRSLGPSCQPSNGLRRKFRRAVSESPELQPGPKPEKKIFSAVKWGKNCYRSKRCHVGNCWSYCNGSLVKFIRNIIYSSSLSSACWLIVPRTDHCDQMNNCQSLPLKNGFLFSLKP